jgi:hypothetical protein
VANDRAGSCPVDGGDSNSYVNALQLPVLQHFSRGVAQESAPEIELPSSPIRRKTVFFTPEVADGLAFHVRERLQQVLERRFRGNNCGRRIQPEGVPLNAPIRLFHSTSSWEFPDGGTGMDVLLSYKPATDFEHTPHDFVRRRDSRARSADPPLGDLDGATTDAVFQIIDASSSGADDELRGAIYRLVDLLIPVRRLACALSLNDGVLFGALRAAISCGSVAQAIVACLLRLAANGGFVRVFEEPF